MQATCPWEGRLLQARRPSHTPSKPHLDICHLPQTQPRHPHRSLGVLPYTTLVICTPYQAPKLPFTLAYPHPHLQQSCYAQCHLALSEDHPKLRTAGPVTVSHGRGRMMSTDKNMVGMVLKASQC